MLRRSRLVRVLESWRGQRGVKRAPHAPSQSLVIAVGAAAQLALERVDDRACRLCACHVVCPRVRFFAAAWALPHDARTPVRADAQHLAGLEARGAYRVLVAAAQ